MYHLVDSKSAGVNLRLVLTMRSRLFHFNLRRLMGPRVRLDMVVL